MIGNIREDDVEIAGSKPFRNRSRLEIDAISGGRVEMGIGAGWYEHEYVGYGYEFPKASVRIGMLREGVEIMQRMWTEEVVSYDGNHYQLDGAICSPKPVQDPHIPLWIAGGGEKLTLNVAARYAAYTNFGQTLDVFNHKSEVLAEHCKDVGTDFDAITRTTNYNAIIGEDEAEVAERTSWVKAHYEPYVGDRVERLIDANYRGSGGFSGTPEQWIEFLQPWQEAGMDYAILWFQDAAFTTRGIELFAEKVIPALQ